MAIPQVSKDSILAAQSYIDKNGVPAANTSTRYQLVSDEGKKYPPKYLIAVAEHIATGSNIDTSSFNAVEAVNYLKKLGFSIETSNDQNNAEIYELTVSADSVNSTDDRFTMDDLGLGDKYKPVDVFLLKADGSIIRRKYAKYETRNCNQTMAKIACQLFENQIKGMTLEEKEQFPVCRYTLTSEIIRGIFPTVEEFRKRRNTIEYLVYKCEDGQQFVFYVWNIFSTLLFVQECLKRFGDPGDKFILRYRDKADKPIGDEWFPVDYNPGFSVEDWIELLHDKSVFNDSSLEIMKRFKDYGGMATCVQLSIKYGENINFYNVGSSALAKRIVDKTGCPVLEKDTENSKWWPVLYLGRHASTDERGSYIWKLRDELAEALDKVDLSGVKLYAKAVLEKPVDSYTKNDFLEEVYMTESRYDTLVAVLRNKKNIILQGAPGVGKTFAAKRLAWSIMNEKDDNRIEFVQFHQNYSYEDFMMGYKPVDEGFELKYGVFYRFCQKAANQPDKDFFFIIDEINRGNMSKIFGELLMLIEKDYRGPKHKLTLAYNGIPFYVPENLYIIGMMNTADRSLAMIDYALRRRFSFFEIEPGFDSEGFVKYQASLKNETMNELILRIKELNREITRDKSLGKGFCIGHSYFCGKKECTTEWLRSVVDYDILPMLSEYWFDDLNTVQRWESILHGVFQ